MKAKKIIAVVVGLSVVVCAAVGGVYAYKNYQQKQLVAEVQPVSNINMGYWGDSQTSYGMVTNDSSQEIYLENSKTVEEIYVQEGDIVSEGDPLMEYDTAELTLQLERKKLDISDLENDIALASHELDELKNAKPVDKTPPSIDTSKVTELEKEDEELNNIPEKDAADSRIYNFITADSLPYNMKTDAATGEAAYPAGTKEEPYIYYCNANAYIYGNFYNSIRATEGKNNGKYVEFYVCKKNSAGKMVMTTVASPDGNGTIQTPEIDTKVTPNPVVFDGNSIPAAYDDTQMWYIFTGEEYVPVSLADEYMSEFMENATDWEEPKGYTAQELIKMIPEKENELKSLDIQKRQQQLELEKMQNSISDGTVYAEVSGVVKTVGDPDEYQSDGTPFLVVTGDEGLYVSGTISELLLDDVEVGTVVTANSWESGMTFEATITEISDYPVSGNSWGEGNLNVSYYSYTAYIEDSSALRNGEYVDLSISTNQSATGGLFIEKAYVRQENGKSYCMIADENDKLKKQYVVTGRTVYGSAVEIKSGLLETDRIAFPYGKNAVEGAAVEEASNTYY